VSKTLVLGGMRSGKSAWAEQRVRRESTVTYVATAAEQPGDADWAARLGVHRDRRPAHWTTVEAGNGLGVLPDALRTAQAYTALLVDDIGGWLTAALDDAGAWDHPDGATAVEDLCDDLVAAVGSCPADVVLVSPEVGWGVVPATRSGRVFADAQGRLNQWLAAACDTVVLVVAGIAVPLKH
jgi:adenosylcobinamide kinase/adenosylcobinamide-phosphate guanylyltransferase